MLAALLVVDAFALAAAFAWASSAKLLRLPEWRRALAGYRLPGAVRGVALIGVPVAEAMVVVLLLAGPMAAGAALALALLTAFSLAVLRARAEEGDRLPCGCFGRTAERDYREMLVRNALLGTLAAAILLARERSGALESLGSVTAGELLPVVLVVAALVVGTWTVREVALSFKRGGTHP